MKVIFHLLILFTVAFCFRQSADLSHFQADTTQASYSCLVNSGINDLVFLAYKSTGQVNSAFPTMVSRAQAAGARVAGAYIFPHTSTDPKVTMEQTATVVTPALLNQSNFKVWLDIEGSQYWLGNYTSNCNYFTKLLIAAVDQFGRNKVGIYASPSQWQAIFGSNSACQQAYSYPLWWARYDGRYDPTNWANNWANFGGWTSNDVYMKQWSGSTAICSTTIDRNIILK